jgi:hypothetical protein
MHYSPYRIECQEKPATKRAKCSKFAAFRDLVGEGRISSLLITVGSRRTCKTERLLCWAGVSKFENQLRNPIAQKVTQTHSSHCIWGMSSTIPSKAQQCNDQSASKSRSQRKTEQVKSDSDSNRQVEEAHETRHTTQSSLGTCTGRSFDL